MKLSICMMVKNEEANLPRCLESLKKIMSDIDSELIVVDTGSEDRTIEIAESYGAKVYRHLWNNNFSEMRNISISYAKGEWIFIIDADEELIDYSNLVNQLKLPNKDISAIALDLQNIISTSGRIGSQIITMRVFRNDGKFYYTGSVHNIPNVEGKVVKVDSMINHYGYIADDEDLMKMKFERTSKLLMQALEEDPTNIYYIFQLGTSYDMYNDDLMAIHFFEKAYNLIKEDQKLMEMHFYLYGSYAKVLVTNKQYDQAIKISLEGLNIKPDYLGLLYFGGLSCLVLKDYDKGIYLVTKYLDMIDTIKTSAIYNNPNVQLYTINSKDEVMVNLASAYLALEKYVEVLDVTIKLMDILSENSDYYEVCINNFVIACIKTNKYEMIYLKYAKISTNRHKNLDVLVYNLMKKHSELNRNDMNIKIANLPSKLGSIFRRLFVDENEIVEVENSELKYYFQNGIAEVLLYSLENSANTIKLFPRVSDLTLMSVFSDLIDNYHELLVKAIFKVTSMINEKLDFESVFLCKTLYKVMMISNMSSEQGAYYFSKYSDKCIQLIHLKYSDYFINNYIEEQLISAEEQFFIYLTNVLECYNVELIFKALNIFPDYNELTIRWLEQKLHGEIKKDNGEESVVINLKNQLKSNIMFLIETGDYANASSLLSEYMDIYPYDLDMLLLKTEILLKQ